MLNKQGFDLWANDYDKTVQISEENNAYPFAGYKEILNTTYNEVMSQKEAKVLDVGLGTGVLTSKLYENGHQIDGVDFSSEMLSIAKGKMPNAHLFEWDITNGLPSEVVENKYDFIVSTYTLHHLSDQDKVSFIKKLGSILNENGKVIIGDVSFVTRAALEACYEDNKGYWDEDEYYFVYEELVLSLGDDYNVDYEQVSHCGGVFIITNK
ncbi:class I SAM-dependent methyltransferase [Alkalibacillus haloalkaliphilus]|uniref:class I SAM-dependent methyltransferase n=1 Tax=Alkalibacillus haloalkaliphilus TaxID=94136 RepID=UPI00293602D4|nr:class I SAM-dependent methyltransferase [Alkalibacillus haloalkaliphilus]MDV2581758.1 class I SAM-dependent methyltransferase [Alkalibacillus haloalkaliphilus]